MNKVVFITGATAGIGAATAIKLAASGFDLILTGRREDRLNQMKLDLESKFAVNVLPVKMDVRDQKSVNAAIHSLSENWTNVSVLINNAGLASGRSIIQEGDVEDWEVMIDTNIKGLLYVTHALLPLLLKNPQPHIINIGSIAGTQTYSGGNVYCATKHAVDALSKTMRIDLLKDGVKVTQIRPGLTETEFSLVRFKGDTEKASGTYAGLKPLLAEDIAEVIDFSLKMPPHVCLNDIEITPLAQANTNYVIKNEI